MVNVVLHLSTLDYVVVSLFLAGILALGFSARLRSNSMLQFLAAGRSLTLPVFVAALVSMWYGGILGMGESVAAFGLGTWVLMGVPYYVFALVYALFFAERVRGADQLTIPERLGLRFGKPVALLAAALVFLLAVPAAHVLMLGALMQSVSGMPLLPCLFIGGAFGLSFLYRGGMLADARVSLLAFVAMYVGFAAIDIWCLSHQSLGSVLASLPDKNMLRWDGGMGTVYVSSFFILGAWTLVDPGFHQRVASSATPAVGKRGVLISIGFWFLFDMLTICAGIYAVAAKTGASSLSIFPALGNAVLPPGLKALFFCGMVGTIVSAFVGYSLVAGTTVGRELAGRIKPTMTDRQQTAWSRVGISVAAVIAILLARSIESVVALWYSWAGAVVGALLIPVAVAYLGRERSRTSGRAIFLSMLVAFAASLVWMIYGLTHGNPYLEVVFLRSGSGWSLFAPDEKNAHLTAMLQKGAKFSLGTLLPGLILSALVIGFGEIAGRRSIKNA